MSMTAKTTPEPQNSRGLECPMSVATGKRHYPPPDVVPGSDADSDHSGDETAVDTGSEAKEPTPDDVDGSQNPTAGSGQMDDNIDDHGRRPDGSTLDQPGTGKP